MSSVRVNDPVSAYLESDSPDFKRLRPLLEAKSEKGTRKIIKGYVQSRKSWIIIRACIFTVVHLRRSCLIVVENKTSALLQLKQRLDEYIEKMSDTVEIDIGVDSVKTLTKKEKLKDVMSSVKPQIVIGLRNDCDMKHLSKNVNEGSDFDVFIDESDVTDAVSRAKCQKNLDYILDNAHFIFCISATILSSMVKDEIEKNNVFIMSKPIGYRDICSLKLVELEESTYSAKKDSEPFQNDQYLKTYLSEFATRPHQGIHPNISLVRVSSTLGPQNKVAKYIQVKHPEIVALTYNGGGTITMRGGALPKSAIKIGRKESNFESKIHSFKDMTIGKVLTWMYRNGGMVKFPRIIILAGKMADRGITFGSDNYSECVDQNKLPWHLTEMYYLTGDKTDQPSIIQAAGRLCGVFPDSLDLTLYSNVAEDVKKSYLLQEELIQRAMQVNDENMSFGDMLETIEIGRSKIPVGRKITAKGVPFHINCVLDEEDEYDQKFALLKSEYQNPESDIAKIVSLFDDRSFRPLTKQEIKSVSQTKVTDLWYLVPCGPKFNLHNDLLVNIGYDE